MTEWIVVGAVVTVACVARPIVDRQLAENQRPLDIPKIDSLDLRAVVRGRQTA